MQVSAIRLCLPAAEARSASSSSLLKFGITIEGDHHPRVWILLVEDEAAMREALRQA